jgi:hypothetical protein
VGERPIIGYKVIAPVVVCKVMSTTGLRYEHLHTGAPIPKEAEETWIGFHLRDQMIAPVYGEEVPEPEAAPEELPAAPPVTAPASSPTASPRRGATTKGGAG